MNGWTLLAFGGHGNGASVDLGKQSLVRKIVGVLSFPIHTPRHIDRPHLSNSAGEERHGFLR